MNQKLLDDARVSGFCVVEEVKYQDHESPQAATQYAIAMALVKLAEDK